RPRPQRPQPVREARLERGRLEQAEYTAEDVLARDAVGQVQHAGEELRLEGGPPGDGGRAAGAAEHGHHGNDNDTDQRVLAVDGVTGVLQVVEVTDDLIQADVVDPRHHPPPGSRRERRHTGCGIRSDRAGRQVAQIAQSERWPWGTRAFQEISSYFHAGGSWFSTVWKASQPIPP